MYTFKPLPKEPEVVEHPRHACEQPWSVSGARLPRTVRTILTVVTVVLLCVATAGGCRNSGTAGAEAEGKRGLQMEMTLKLDRTDLTIGEDTGLSVEVRNTTAAPVTLPDPTASPSWPRMVLVNAATGDTAVFGPLDAVGDPHYAPPLPEVDLTLAPGASASLTAMLLQRVRFPKAGSYRLEATIEIDGRMLTSPPADITIAPLDLRSVVAAGAHSGPTPFQNILWSQAEGGGSILFLTTISLDHEGHPYIVESTRIERIDAPAQPVLSVSPNGSPFPGKWLFWLDGGASPAGGGGMTLQTIYAMQGQVERTLPPRPLGNRPQTMIGPALHDFDEEDASRPGPGEVVLWSSLEGRSLVQVFTAKPNGTLTAGISFEAQEGRLAWGSAALLSDGERRAVLAVEGRKGANLQLAQWKRGASNPGRTSVLFEWSGTMVASGATLNAQDDWLGATILKGPEATGNELILSLWTIGRVVRVQAPESIPFHLPGGEPPGRAIVGRSPGGALLALVSDTRGHWSSLDAAGRCEPLPARLTGLGEPALILWPGEATALILFVSSDRGFSVRNF